MQAQTERPPYVTFEVRAEEDREASLREGLYMTKDVDYAIITPAGSKDRTERRVDEWFTNLSQQVREGRFADEWLAAYRKAYIAWKEDRVIPDDGHPIVNWPVASPSQIRTLQDLSIRTVEALASANEETLLRLGMGARALKQRAVDWLAAAESGKVSGDMEQIRTENEALKLRLEALEAQNTELRTMVTAQAQGQPQPTKL